MISNNQDLCQYSTLSLLFYLFFPLVKIAQLLQIPQSLGYIIALASPPVILDFSIKWAQRFNRIQLVKHGLNPDHAHNKDMTFGVSMRSGVLGLLCYLGISFIAHQADTNLILFGTYLILLSFFHFSEYFVTSLTNSSTLSLDSFLLDQSAAYMIAITGSFIEFTIEAYLFPEFKRFSLLAWTGLSLAILGEIIRKSAMFTAKRSFSHTISEFKSPDHTLITHGIYGIFRHPSYAGWFFWAIATQMLLQNPICLVAFALISHNFFKNRILYEEETLLRFFGKDYESYKSKVGIWMPIYW